MTVIALSLAAQAGFAQPKPATTPPTSQSAAESEPPDPLGRDTPRGSVVGFLKAVERGSLNQASEYLDARGAAAQVQKLAQQLAVVLNQGLSVDLDALSRSPEGDLDDELPPNRDRIGSVQTTSRPLDILLVRVTRGKERPIWLFSSETLRGVPRSFKEVEGTGIQRIVPQALKTNRFLSIPLWRWLSLILFIAIAFTGAPLVTRILELLFRPTIRRLTGEAGTRHLRALRRPLSLLLLALACLYPAQWGGSFLARTFWASLSVVVAAAGLSWLLMVLSDIVSDLRSRKLIRMNATGQIAVLALGRRLFKILVLFFALVFLLHRAGVNVSAVLAGLGIGGIALALGAQKTMEDLLGGIMIITRQSVRVGDFCQLAGASGTVEDIGLSSTRVRTPSRTLISMPNSQISQMNLENFSMRDKIWFHHVFGLRYNTRPETLRSVLDNINQALREHARVETETARLRFIEFGPSSLNLEISAYINETDFAAFLVIQEELMLRVMEIVTANGASLALPSQITYFDRHEMDRVEQYPPLQSPKEPSNYGRALPSGRLARDDSQAPARQEDPGQPGAVGRGVPGRS